MLIRLIETALVAWDVVQELRRQRQIYPTVPPLRHDHAIYRQQLGAIRLYREEISAGTTADDVLLEETAELLEARSRGDMRHARVEAVQIAAFALRVVLDLGQNAEGDYLG